MRLLLAALLLFGGLSASAQSNLPPCPAATIFNWHNCFGTYTFPNGEKYVGEWRGGKRFGQGTYTYPEGVRYVGEYWDDQRDGQGIVYASNGSILLSGRWEHGRLAQSLIIDTSKFPFDSERAATVSHAELERRKREDSEARLAAEVQAERRKRQELEDKLAVAERQQTAPARQPQAILRNERRLALVIGNSAYKINPLVNPANDATDIADSLTKVGFQTTVVQNATLSQMREATRRFADRLPSADVALIYFAGHGIESNRKNYLIPVNADLKFEYELAEQAYDAGVWLNMLESIKSTNTDRVNIVILDACRNNNLIGSRSIGRGLGKMDAPTGTFLAYSTAPGKVAADGTQGDRNSPFTKHLLRAMQQPNLPIEEVFKEVRRNVGRETSGAQVPWESTSLTGHFTFRQAR